jgi:hypothetical protein
LQSVLSPSNYQKWSEFFEGLSDVKPITKITHNNGARFIYKVKMMGLKVTIGTEWNDYKENEGWIGKSFRGLPHQIHWIFKESNGSTEFTYIQQYDLPLYFGGKFIDKMFLQPQLTKIINNSLQNLKRLTEEK